MGEKGVVSSQSMRDDAKCPQRRECDSTNAGRKAKGYRRMHMVSSSLRKRMKRSMDKGGWHKDKRATYVYKSNICPLAEA